MNKIIILVLFARILLSPVQVFSQVPGCPDCHLPDTRNPLEKQVALAAYTLDSAYQFRAPVYITSGKTEIVGDNSIAVTKDLIQELSGRDKDLEQLVLLITLAHERAHILQHKVLAADFINDPNRKLMLECQADMEAGAFIARRYVDLYGDQLNHFTSLADTTHISVVKIKKIYKQSNDFYAEALEIFVNLSLKHQHTVHPLSVQRMVAAKTGFSLGLVTQAERLLPFYRLFFQDMPGNDQQKLNELRFFSLQALDFRNTDNQWSWSMRQSERITHPNPIPRRYLQVEDQQIDFDTSAVHPMVYYEFQLRNTAPFSIQCDFGADCTMSSRLDPDRLQLSSTVTSKNYSINLAPGRTYQVKDSLTWYANKEMMPTLRLVPDPASFYVIDFVNQGDANRYGGQFIENSNIQPSDIPERLDDILGWIARDKANGFNNIKASPVLLDDDSSRTFYCFSPASGIMAWLRPHSEPYVTFDLFEGNEADAITLFDTIVQEVKDFYSDKMTIKLQPGTETNGVNVIAIRLTDKTTGNRSMLLLNIKKNRTVPK